MRITSKLYFDKYVAVKNEKTLYEPEIGRKYCYTFNLKVRNCI